MRQPVIRVLVGKDLVALGAAVVCIGQLLVFVGVSIVLGTSRLRHWLRANRNVGRSIRRAILGVAVVAAIVGWKPQWDWWRTSCVLLLGLVVAYISLAPERLRPKRRGWSKLAHVVSGALSYLIDLLVIYLIVSRYLGIHNAMVNGTIALAVWSSWLILCVRVAGRIASVGTDNPSFPTLSRRVSDVSRRRRPL